MPLTAAQYKSEMDNALAKYDASNITNLDRGVAWLQIASGYSHLWAHQLLFDAKGITPSAAAQGYRVKAEGYATKAKNWAGPINTPKSVAASQAFNVAAYAYVQLVKAEAMAAESVSL